LIPVDKIYVVNWRKQFLKGWMQAPHPIRGAWMSLSGTESKAQPN
jgi:hypothetical protein